MTTSSTLLHLIKNATMLLKFLFLQISFVLIFLKPINLVFGSTFGQRARVTLITSYVITNMFPQIEAV